MFGRRDQTSKIDTAGEERNTGITSQSNGLAASTAETATHGAVAQGSMAQGSMAQGSMAQGSVAQGGVAEGIAAQSAESQSAESQSADTGSADTGSANSGSAEPRGIAATVAEALAKSSARKPAQDKAEDKSQPQARNKAQSLTQSKAPSEAPSETVATATPANCDGADRAPRPTPKVPEAPAQTKTTPKTTPRGRPALKTVAGTCTVAGKASKSAKSGNSTGTGNPGDAAPDAVQAAKRRIQSLLMDAIDPREAAKLERAALELQLKDLIGELLLAEKIMLNQAEQGRLVSMVVDDMIGLGPIEPLLADDSITEIMVNGPKHVYVERDGKIERTGITFHDNRHVMNAAVRIASRVGRRIDETTPYCDARLEDGSRVNIVIPPLALDGPTITIRKFAKKKFSLEMMAKTGSITPEMAVTLMVAGRSGANILISGGTGSGKTTLLNAISETIDPAERIVTIEDAAELQLQQPHVVRLETRPANIEGKGDVSMRDLLKNALRMRPDRIILGEVRGAEVVDMLQAMNTGHDGSLSTVHANSPREATMRLENLIAMAGIDLPAKAARTLISSAIDMVVQVSRMRDGSRRITQISEVLGTEGEVITMQDLFVFEYEGEDADGRVLGSLKYTGVQPKLLDKARYHGLDQALMQALASAGDEAQAAEAEAEAA